MEEQVAMIRDYGAQAKAFYAAKDIAGMIACGEAGVALGLITPSAEIETAVKILAYNVAANCWPGWDDHGIVITPAQIAAGLAMATESHRLVQKLHLGAEQRGHANWLIGALHLAAGNTAPAGDAFAAAAAAFTTAAMPPEIAMANAYLALSTGTPADFTAAVQTLQQLNTEDATSYAEQLQTAARVLRP